VVGCEINIQTTQANADDQNAFNFSGVTGRVWVEGVWAHGAPGIINDGIKGNSGQAIWTAQNSRIGPLYGGQSGYHSDVLQPYGGFKRLEIDNVTGYGEFQCLMAQLGDAIIRGSQWNETDIGRFDCHDTAVPGAEFGKLLNIVNNGNTATVGPIHFSYFGQEFFIEPHPTTLTAQDTGSVPLTNSISPVACFTFAGGSASPTETATANKPGCLSSAPNFVMDGVAHEMQQREASNNAGWFEYVKTPAEGGNVGMGYVLP